MNLEIRNNDAYVLVCPDVGGAIARFTWRDIDILRPASDVAIAEKLVDQMGAYPLIPYSNRIGFGKLVVGGETHTLRANFLPEPHPIHGFGWQREWDVVSTSDASVQLHLAHMPDSDWPFACEALQRLELAGGVLTFSLSVRNTDSRLMPAGLGIHPFFPLVPGVRLRSEWTNMWTMNSTKLPVECVAAPPKTNYAQLRLMEGWTIDHCFSGWTRSALLEYPTHRVELTASKACSQIVCFAPNDGRAFIALEPVSHVNDALALAARGVSVNSMRMLEPHEELSMSMSIAVGAQGVDHA